MNIILGGLGHFEADFISLADERHRQAFKVGEMGIDGVLGNDGIPPFVPESRQRIHGAHHLVVVDADALDLRPKDFYLLDQVSIGPLEIAPVKDALSKQAVTYVIGTVPVPFQ